jgi:hypothetical protein
MLLKLRIRSDVDEFFLMHIIVDANNTTSQLHDVIQQECKYDPLQTVSVYLADEEWDKGEEIIRPYKGGYSDSKNGGPLWENIRIGELIKTPEDKLIYAVGQYDKMSFYIDLVESEMGKTIDAPVVTLKKGNAPNQFPDQKVEVSVKSTSDPELQSDGDDFGEIEDLQEIYGEMSGIL